MRKLHAALLAAGGAALVAGTAYAAGKINTMNVALPDGSIAQIRYEGDVAPKVAIVPVEAGANDTFANGTFANDPFAELERMSAMMQARHQAMMRQVAEMQQRAQRQILAAQQGRGGGQPGQIVVSTNAPAGSYSFTSVTTTSAGGCTETVQYRSDGSGAEPKVTRASSGDCSAVSKNAPPVPAAAAAPMKDVPGTKMIFPGMPDAAKRKEVIDYLATLK
jgi:hypothetical protein